MRFAGIASFASLCAVVAPMLCACGQSGSSDVAVELKNRDDSLSFAVGMLVSSEMPRAMAELGIDETTLDDFVRGLCDAFPVDDSPEAVAYSHGVVMASAAKDLLESADAAIYPGDTVKKVNRRLFLEALKASAYNKGDVMPREVAVDYYNESIFRSASEEFMRSNKERPGVVVLPSGVQYKVEVAGTGKVATSADVVSCIYKGTYPNGSTFDSSRGYAVDLPVNSVVPGLAEVLTKLPEGTSCMVYIPWERAYGAEGYSSIPPYSALVFELEIVKIK